MSNISITKTLRDGTTITLPIDEARELYSDLAGLFVPLITYTSSGNYQPMDVGQDTTAIGAPLPLVPQSPVLPTTTPDPPQTGQEPAAP